MLMVGKNEVTRERLFAIFMFEEKGAPFIPMGVSWDMAAAAIDRDADPLEGYFVGFKNVVKATVDKLVESLSSEMESKIQIWVNEVNYQAFFGGVDSLDLGRAKVYYLRHYSSKENYTWGFAYLLRP